MSQITICIIIFLISLILYAVNKYSFGTIGMITMAALLVTGCLSPKDALTYFANKNVILMLSMFVVSESFTRTSMIDRFSAWIGKMTGNSFKHTYLCYIILAAVLTNFLNSPLVVFTLMLPLVSQMCRDYDISPSKVMFPIGLVCIACCGIMPFGASISSTGLYNGYLESYEYTGVQFEAIDFLIGRWPFLIIVPVWCYFFGLKFSPEKPVTEISGFSGEQTEKVPLKPLQEIVGVLVFFTVVVLFIFSSKLHLEAWLICFCGAVVNLIFGVLTSKEAVKCLPVSLVCMLIGALAMAGSLTATGAADIIGVALSNVVGNIHNRYVFGAVFFLIPFFLTQFMQNQAVMAIFVPICLLACKPMNANPIGLMVLITAGSLTAFMTPMATSSLPVIMGAGRYDIKSLIRQGIIPSILFSVIYIFYTMTVLPCF